MKRKDQIALGLTAAVAVLLLLSRQAAAGPAAPGVVPGPGPGPSPSPTPTPTPVPAPNPALDAARGLMETMKSNSENLPPAQREQRAQALEKAADGYTAAGQPQAAEELRAAASDLRRRGAGQVPSTSPTLLEEFHRLQKRASDYLHGRGAASMDDQTLQAMDRVADQLARATPPMPVTSAALVQLANASYERSGLRRPITMSL